MAFTELHVTQLLAAHLKYIEGSYTSFHQNRSINTVCLISNLCTLLCIVIFFFTEAVLAKRTLTWQTFVEKLFWQISRKSTRGFSR